MAKRILDPQALGAQTPTTQNIMLRVLLGLVPGTILMAILISPLVLLNVAAAIGLALAFEALALKLRGQTIKPGLCDGSIALAAALLALAVPPMLPLWQLLIGVFIMVMLGKHVYGGLGNNPFNPAMVGYAALLVSFPQSMTLWLLPPSLLELDLNTQLVAKFSLSLLSADGIASWDGLTRATPLEEARTTALYYSHGASIFSKEQFFESNFVWVNVGFLIGGLMLMHQRLIHWYIPLSVFAGFLLGSVMLSSSGVPLPYSLFSGALVLGAFFIATDPVTAASSRRGQLVFGFGIGVITYVIREYGGYPEGFAFAVLLMNLCVPLIDHIDLQLGKTSS